MTARVLAVTFASLMLPMAASAGPIQVGSGGSVAHSVINFGDGAEYTFDVRFDGTTTGIGLFDIIEAQSSLVTDRQVYSFGTLINGITFGGDSNIGFAGGDNWWHYWIKDSGQTTWTSPGFGPSDRTVHDGDSDGWVYGRATEPVPEPAAFLLAVPALLLVRRRPISRHA